MYKELQSNLNKYIIEKNASKRLTQSESESTNDRNARRQNFCQSKFKHVFEASKHTRGIAMRQITPP